MTLDEAMERYKERFDDQYPRYCAQGMSDDEIISEIEDCLKRGRPFEPEADVLY